MASLSIFRGNNTFVAEIPIDEKLIIKKELMNENTITATGLVKTSPLPIQINDYITVSGIKYKINFVPDLTADHLLTYQIVFEAPEYTLFDKIVTHLGTGSFPYYGTVQEQLQLIINSANEIDPGWTLGTIEATDEQFMDYDNFTCRTAITKAAEQFGLEFEFINKQINFVKSVGTDTDLEFEFGRNKGLYSIGRKYISDKNVKTRVLGFGGDKNLPKNYRNMPRPLLRFNGLYKENNVDKYGVKEAVYSNPEIYPKRESTCSDVGPVSDNSTEFTITDSTIDFDVNDYLLDSTATVSFLSGQLYGESFDILDFNNSTKVFTLKSKTNNANIKLPYPAFKANVGDKFALFNISLPGSYVILAENQLEAETEQFVDENSSPQIELSLNFNTLYIKTFGVTLKPGDRIKINEPRLGIINEVIRVSGVSYPFDYHAYVGPNTFFTATLSNTITYTQQVRAISTAINQKIEIKNIALSSIAESKRSAYNLRLLEGSIFDTDGLFDSDKINVGTLSTALAIVGVKSQNFVLNGVKLVDNYNANPNSVFISAGQLIHLEYSNPGNLSTWSMSAFTENGLVSNKFYYIYALCNKSNQTGGWLISEGQNKVDDIPGVYTFLAGVIYPVNNGFRDTDFTYGITDITGNRIKTGIIAGRNNALEINLETGAIKGDVTFTGSSLSNINSISGTANSALSNAGTALSNAATALSQANLAISNAAAVQSNLSALQNGLGGLAYENAVELARLGTSIVQGGYIKTNLIETNALIIAGGLATQTYATNQASSYASTAQSNAQSYAATQASLAQDAAAIDATAKALAAQNTATANAATLAQQAQNAATNYTTTQVAATLTAAQTYAQAQATQAKADAIANAASDAFARSYAAGKMLNRDPEFTAGYNGISVYNNNGNGTVQIGYGSNGAGDFGASIPNSSNKYIAINYNGGGANPGLGGFYFATQTRANAIFITRLMAFIPVGFAITWQSNAGAQLVYTSDLQGIGTWKEYLFVVKCPNSSSSGFSSTNFFALSGPDTNLGWYLASATVYDMTAAETDPIAYTDTKATATINAAQSYADSVAISKANIAQANAISSASADATAKANAARANAVSDSQLLINSIQLGAVNLILNSKYSNGSAGYLLYDGTLSEPLIQNQQYTFSTRIDSANGNFGIWNAQGSTSLAIPLVNVGNGIYTATFTAPNTNGNLNIRIYNTTNSGGAVEYAVHYWSKLERGSKRSDWSPAVADVDTSIANAQTAANNAVNAYNNLTATLKQTAFQDIEQWAYQGTTIVSGGYITASLLNVGYIQANVVTAGYINTLDIVSKSIRTATSGVKRVEILQSTNSIIFYSALNEELVRVDDNLAMLTAGNPVTPPTYGAGIRIGNGGATTMISRYGFSVTGSEGALLPKSFIGTVGGGYTGYVKLDVEGGLILNNIAFDGGTPATMNVKVTAAYLTTQAGDTLPVLTFAPI